jgi:hypothetical protein
MKNNRMLFNIDIPEGWQDQTVHTFMGPDDSGIVHMLTVIIDRDVGEMELDEFARERIDNVIDTIHGIEILKDEPKDLENGRKVHEFVYRWIPTPDKVIFKKHIFMILGGTGYTFSADFSKKTLKTIARQVEQMINSFEPVEIPGKD